MDSCNVRIYQLALRTFTPEGTIQSAEKLLSHIALCGFTHVQLSPVVEADDDPEVSGWSNRQRASGMGNPNNNYRLKDYFRIDPEYGTGQDLHSFVRTAHRLGLKIIIDLVYFHCGPNATLIKEHPDFIERNPDGTIKPGEWNFPVLDYTKPDLREYMWGNMEYFIQEYDIDGYRCDVGDYVPVDFWREGIRRCRALKKDFFMLNEGTKIEYLENGFDCNYFSNCCFDSVKIPAYELTAAEYQAKWQEWREQLPDGGRLLHFLENHDVCSDSYDKRFEKVFGSAAMEVQHVLIFTLDGVPFVFNGNELADHLKHNMFSNRFHGRDDTLQWENAVCEVGIRRMNVVKKLNALWDEFSCMSSGNLEWISHDCPESVLAYIRSDGKQSILAVLNLRDKPVEVSLKFSQKPFKTLMERYSCFDHEGMQLKMQLLGYGYLVAEID